MQFIGYNLSHDRRIPVSTGSTHRQALEKAMERVLSITRDGYIEVRDRGDLHPVIFQRLEATLNQFFA